MQAAMLRDAEEIERYFLATTGMKPGYQQLVRGAVHLSVRAAELDGVSIIWTRGGGRARWRDEMSGNGLHLGFAIECDGPIRSRGRALGRSDGQLWMRDKEMDLILGGRNLTLDVGVSRELVEELGWQYGGDPIASVPDQVLDRFVYTCARRTGSTDVENDPARSPGRNRNSRDVVLQSLEAVLDPWMTARGDSTAKHRSQSYQMVESADEFFERLQPGEKLNVDDLAQSLGVSRRTVFHAFRKQYGIGPRRYFELKRLHSLRASLRTAEPGDASVSRLAGDLGFDDLGRMAQRYHELFNEFPSETLNRIN